MPRSQDILDAALLAAESILHVAAVRRARLIFMSGGDLRLLWSAKNGEKSAFGDMRLREALKGSEGECGDPNVEELVRRISVDRGKTFSRLYDYERRAVSRQRRLLTRLDYLVIEAHRAQKQDRPSRSRHAAR